MRLIYGCVLYKRNYGNPYTFSIDSDMKVRYQWVQVYYQGEIITSMRLNVIIPLGMTKRVSPTRMGILNTCMNKTFKKVYAWTTDIRVQRLGAVSRRIVKYDSISYGKKPITDDIRNSESALLESSVYFPSWNILRTIRRRYQVF